jgi:hypothetical protein
MLQCFGGSDNLGCTRTVGDCYQAWLARAAEDAKTAAVDPSHDGIVGAYEPSTSSDACQKQAKARGDMALFAYNVDSSCTMWTNDQVNGQILTFDAFVAVLQGLFDQIRPFDVFLHETKAVG